MTNMAVNTIKVEFPIELSHIAERSADIETEEDDQLLLYAVLLTLEKNAEILEKTDDDEGLSEATRLFWQTRVI
jgi:hypothetical protein